MMTFAINPKTIIPINFGNQMISWDVIPPMIIMVSKSFSTSSDSIKIQRREKAPIPKIYFKSIFLNQSLFKLLPTVLAMVSLRNGTRVSFRRNHKFSKKA